MINCRRDAAYLAPGLSGSVLRQGSTGGRGAGTPPCRWPSQGSTRGSFWFSQTRALRLNVTELNSDLEPDTKKLEWREGLKGTVPRDFHTIFPRQSYAPFLAFEQQVKIFTILVKISLRYSNFKFKNSDSAVFITLGRLNR